MFCTIIPCHPHSPPEAARNVSRQHSRQTLTTHRVQLIAHQPANTTALAAADCWGPVPLLFLFTVFLAICLVIGAGRTMCGWLLLLLLLLAIIIIISSSSSSGSFT
jgi:uncharacterized membrane protein YphA (DoxX/SURF4 family)